MAAAVSNPSCPTQLVMCQDQGSYPHPIRDLCNGCSGAQPDALRCNFNVALRIYAVIH